MGKPNYGTILKISEILSANNNILRIPEITIRSIPGYKRYLISSSQGPNIKESGRIPKLVPYYSEFNIFNLSSEDISK